MTAVKVKVMCSSDVIDGEIALGVLESDRCGGGSPAGHSHGNALQALYKSWE